MVPEIITLCASHIGTLQRLHTFSCMLESVSQQTHRIQMYISISVDKSIDIHFIDELRSKYGDWLHLFHTSGHFSQFEHYKILCDILRETKITSISDCWCLFKDDDDVWEEHKVEEYFRAIKNSNNNVVVF